MDTKNGLRLNRRDLLKIGGAMLFGSAADIRAAEIFDEVGPACSLVEEQEFLPCSGGNVIEEYPTSPLIGGYVENGVVKGRVFIDECKFPPLLRPVLNHNDEATWAPLPKPKHTKADTAKQDSFGHTHQIWTSDLCLPDPIYYRIRVEVGEHSFTSLPALPIDRNGSPVPVPQGAPGPANAEPRPLPPSTIYGFSRGEGSEGPTFPGPIVRAEYGKPCLVRFENHLDKNPKALDRGDFGSPVPKKVGGHGLESLVHLHNAHTAPESDGNPNHHLEGYKPGQFVDNLYLNHPPDSDDNEKQSFLWFHDHFEGHTGANVYKGMVGLYPIYDPTRTDGQPGLDPGDETKGLHLPGVRTNNGDGTFNVEYDIPFALYDCRLNDGVTPHQDFHNGCGETHPEWWGRTFFRHFPNHGFVGDVFTVNGCAYPRIKVKRRQYRLRFLDASVARDYELVLMRSVAEPIAAPGIQGQYLLPDGQRCMPFVLIASEGGLLPASILHNSIRLSPAKRREAIVDFTRYADNTKTKKGDVIYLVNIAKMDDGRKPDSSDPSYKVPILKIEIEADELAPDASDKAFDNEGRFIRRYLRPLPVVDLSEEALAKLPHRSFELERGGGFGGETEWLINDLPFVLVEGGCALPPLACPQQGYPEVWTIKNGGGGWTHPMHFHQEEHRVLSRNGVPTPRVPGISEDWSKEDTIALAPGEEVVIYRNFRTFTGKYVAHCHNLAHEDHNMMFGWDILPGKPPKPCE